MADLLPFSEILGFWLGIFLTMAILSFLYKDNPFYKFAEHLFIGVSIGYIVAEQYHNVLEPKVVDRLRSDLWYLALIPLVLFMMMAARTFGQRYAWLGRYPIALVVALYAAMEVNALAESDLGAQLQRSMADLDVEKLDVNTAPATQLAEIPGVTPEVALAIVARRAERPITSIDEILELPGLSDAEKGVLAAERGPLVGLDSRLGTTPGEANGFKIFSEILLLLGLIASLVYFYFSIEQKGVVGKVSRFGVWILMIGFGASFGYTVQGRLSLAIGRALDVLDANKSADLAARIHGPVVGLLSIAVIVGGLIVWEIRQRRRDRSPPGSTGPRPQAMLGD